MSLWPPVEPIGERRHLHPGADDDARVDRPAQGHVDELAGADVAHRGEARPPACAGRRVGAATA